MGGKRYINSQTRRTLQVDKCANSPDKPAIGCIGYMCPMWRCNDGLIDESGHNIDHIIEVATGGTNDSSNLQVLCVSCHSVKTKRAARLKWLYNSIEIDNGAGFMEVERSEQVERSEPIEPIVEYVVERPRKKRKTD